MAAPAWKLHPLKGKLANHRAVWVSGDWRLTFTFANGDVELVDYLGLSLMNIMHNPSHPGEVLRDWLAKITVTDAAKRLGVTRVALSRVLNGAAGISAEMDIGLSKALGTSPVTWYAMQASFDLCHARKRFRGKVQATAVAA